MTDRTGRRGLLGALFGAPKATTPEVAAAVTVAPEQTAAKVEAFSLSAFYAKREGEPAPPLPHVELRRDLPAVPTTRVGLCPPPEELVFEDEQDEVRT